MADWIKDRPKTHQTIAQRLAFWKDVAWIYLVVIACCWFLLMAINPDFAMLPFLAGWDAASWWYGVPH